MKRVAVVTCEGLDVDPDSPLLLDALDDVGLNAQLRVWDDPRVSWDDYDLVVVRSTWDYAARREEFLAWARSVAHLVNPYRVIEYSSDKHYLGDLERRGHAVVATTFVDVGEAPRFPDVDFVVKPAAGAGSIDAERYRPDEVVLASEHVARLHGASRDVIIQPYVDSVDESGERALVFIDAAFSHAMTKGAMLNVTGTDRNNLFRREQMSLATPEPDAVAFASRVLDEFAGDDLLYARVDLVRVDDAWAIMELELVEPSLFLGYDEGAARRLARAIARRVG